MACASARLAARRGAAAGRRAWACERLWIKDDSRNPTLSFKDRVVAVAAARAAEWGFHTLACASTGNLSASVAAAAAARGLRAVVFVPADLEPAKVAQARALGATVVRVEGPYDEVNRLCLELTDELEGWAVLNVNLRPYYAEGSKTIAFEIAQQLGWRTPDVLVAPLASGSLYTKLARGFHELAAVGLRRRGAPCATWAARQPVARRSRRRSGPARTSCTPVERPDTVVRSLAIGSPADGAYALRLARESDGAILGVPDEATVAAIRLLAETRGHPHRDRRRRDPRGPAARHRRRHGRLATTRSSWSSRAMASRPSTSSRLARRGCPSRSCPRSRPSRPGGSGRRPREHRWPRQPALPR